MPKKNRSGSKKKQQQLVGFTRLPRVPRAQPTFLKLCNVTYSNNGLSSGAGAAGVITGSGITGTSEFSGVSGLYAEYRLLAMQIHVVPTAQVGAFYMGLDRSAAVSTPTTSTAMAALQAPRVFVNQTTSAKPFVYNVKATDLQDQNFTPVGSPSNPWRVFVWGQLTGTANTVNTTTMISGAVFTVQFLAEFKSAF